MKVNSFLKNIFLFLIKYLVVVFCFPAVKYHSGEVHAHLLCVVDKLSIKVYNKHISD